MTGSTDKLRQVEGTMLGGAPAADCAASSAADPVTRSASHPVGRRLGTALTCLVCVVGVASLAGFLGLLWWVLDLASHFRSHYGLFFLGAAVVFCLARKFRKAALPGVLALVNLAPVAPLYLGSARTTAADTRVYRALLINADYQNTSPEKVAAFVDQANADLIVFVEFSPSLQEALEPLRSRYPFARSAPQTSGRGIALWSRLPCSDMEVRSLDPSGFLSVRCRVSLADQALTVVGTHAPWPIGAGMSQHRGEHFAELARLVQAQAQNGPLMIVGDLNCTSGSPHFQRLLQEGGLNDSRRGFGVQPTWPTWMPLVGIAIDHCLVTPGVTIHDRRIGPDVGSDHFPVVIDFSVEKADG